MSRHVILFVAANPRGHDEPRLTDECAAIQREISRAPFRDDFRFESRWAVGVDALIHHLTELAPVVLHVSGHGGGSAGLMLQDADGRPEMVSGDALAQIVEVAAPRLRVAVLNACYSAEQAEALRRRVDCVVGMTGEIGDEAARCFAGRFYAALGARLSIGTAVAQGVAALSARQLPDGVYPRCMTRPGVDADTVMLGPPPPERDDGSRSAGASRRNAFAGLAVLAIPPIAWGRPASDVPGATARSAASAASAGPASGGATSAATRAVQYQHALLEEFGKPASEGELIQEAIDNQLYISKTGMHLEDIARQLEGHGLELHREAQAHSFHLANELGSGHKVLIGVYAHELTDAHGLRHDIGRELGFGSDGHAVIVCGIDTSDPDHHQVVVTDPRTGAAGPHYDFAAFVDAWRGCEFSMVSTAEPCPYQMPEMQHFDYRAGHVPMIGGAPFELVQDCCAAAAHDTGAHAIGDLESQFLCAMHGHGADGAEDGLGHRTGHDVGDSFHHHHDRDHSHGSDPGLAEAWSDPLDADGAHGVHDALEDLHHDHHDHHDHFEPLVAELDLDADHDATHHDGADHDAPIDPDPLT